MVRHIGDQGIRITGHLHEGSVWLKLRSGPSYFLCTAKEIGDAGTQAITTRIHQVFFRMLIRATVLALSESQMSQTMLLMQVRRRWTDYFKPANACKVVSISNLVT